MTESASSLMVMANALSLGLAVLLMLAFIVIVAAFVRPRRPDAAWILLLGLILDLVLTVGATTAQTVVPRFFIGGSDPTVFAQTFAMISVLNTIGQTAGRVLVIWGVVRLASDKPTT